MNKIRLSDQNFWALEADSFHVYVLATYQVCQRLETRLEISEKYHKVLIILSCI
jgi:hypothetical protein